MIFAKLTLEHRADIAETCCRIEQTGSADDARQLGALLDELLALMIRNPGLEMAAKDLYEAAAAISLHDTQTSNTRPQRRFRDARERFEERVATAMPLIPARPK